ncbi:MAG TPA: hypothetical protein VGD98_24615 [Ktedonobacteraceae bacterium]
MKSVLHVCVIATSLVLLSSCALCLNLALAQATVSKQLAYAQLSHLTTRDAVASNSAVLTYKYDNRRTGSDTHETILTPTNVNAKHFGKRIAYPVDGQTYAQPLYVPDLTIQDQTHNVVFVATEHDSVYAFDANAQDPGQGLIWHTSFLLNDALTPTNRDVSCNDTIPEMGITGTPVIDARTETMYVVAFTRENGQFLYRLHALDITSGQDKASIVIQASIAGSGLGSIDRRITFDARYERQRAALVLGNNGKVYIAWGSFCDHGPYHGWIMSYAFDGATLHLANVFNDTADAREGGLWGSGGALGADEHDNIYYISGNGGFNLNLGGHSSGDSVVMLSSDLHLRDYFTPFNQACLSHIDADLGSSGPLLEPDHPVIIAAGKEGRIYVINQRHMGQYHTMTNPCGYQRLTTVDQVLQESAPGQIGGLFNSPSYWNGYVYLASVNRPTGAYRLTSRGTFRSFTPSSYTPEAFGFTGGNLVISSNGSANGILWTIDRGNTQGPALRAYDATNLSRELYSSNQYADRDALEGFVKFTSPIVADGLAFVPTSTHLAIYGIVPESSPPPPVTYNNTGVSDDSYSGHILANFDGNGHSYSANALRAAGITPGSSLLYHNLTFIWPVQPAGSRDNYLANGQTVPLPQTTGTTTLAFLGSASGDSSSGTATINYTDNSSQDFTLGLTSWASQKPAFDNDLAATMTYRYGPQGKELVKTSLFIAQVIPWSGKILKSVTLPTAASGTNKLHIFAFATNSTPGSYNNAGTSDDSNPTAANFNGMGASYSAKALQAQGCNPGDNAFFRGQAGTVFQWSSGNSGELNNYIANGQTLEVNPLSNATTLAFAGASAGTPVSGTATIHYSDGSDQSFSLGFSDWTLNNGKARPSFGNQVMYTMAYHNTPNGRVQIPTYIFYASVSLEAGKTIQSVTLPTAEQGQMHIFAITTRTTQAS